MTRRESSQNRTQQRSDREGQAVTLVTGGCDYYVRKRGAHRHGLKKSLQNGVQGKALEKARPSFGRQTHGLIWYRCSSFFPRKKLTGGLAPPTHNQPAPLPSYGGRRGIIPMIVPLVIGQRKSEEGHVGCSPRMSRPREPTAKFILRLRSRNMLEVLVSDWFMIGLCWFVSVPFLSDFGGSPSTPDCEKVDKSAVQPYTEAVLTQTRH